MKSLDSPFAGIFVLTSFFETERILEYNLNIPAAPNSNNGIEMLEKPIDSQTP